MNLILWRHAEAEDGGLDLPDAARQLTQNGRNQAKRMARWLNSHLPDKPHILVSPSVRTQQTADALGLTYQREERLFDTGVDDYLTIIRTHQDHKTLVLVAHQPTLGALASLLLCGKTQSWEVEKGSVWWLRLHQGEAPRALALVAVVSPELL